MAFPNEKQWLEYLLAEYADRPASSGLAEQMFHAINTRLNHLKASGRTDDKDFLCALQDGVRRVIGECRIDHMASSRLGSIYDSIQARLTDKPTHGTPYLSEIMDRMISDDRVPNGMIILDKGSGIGPTGMLRAEFISFPNSFSSPQTNTAMADTKQTNEQESAKAAKRRRIAELQRRTEYLKKLKDQITTVRKNWSRSSHIPCENQDSVAGSIRVYVDGGNINIPSPDFMSHGTYWKLYLNEIDEDLATIEQEMDTLTA